jgi:hypothetical protein
MRRMTLAAIAAAVLLAGCGQAAHAPRPVTTVTVAATPATPATTYPYGNVSLCAAAIEVGTANGHDYSGLRPHDPRLPYTCQALDLAHLTKAAGRALRDMLNS